MSNVNGPLCRSSFVHYLPGNSPFVTWSTFFVGAAEAARGLTKRQIAVLGAAEVVEQEVHSGYWKICSCRQMQEQVAGQCELQVSGAWVKIALDIGECR